MPSASTIDNSIVLASLLIFVFAYLLIVRRDGSWVNWATPFFIIQLGQRYVLPPVYTLLVHMPNGSEFAYWYCYATYALSFLSAALAYSFLKPLRLRTVGVEIADSRLLITSWALFGIGVLFYLPVLVEFRAYLNDPRRIYEMTRSGYGVYFLSSTLFATLGFITYMFCRQKGIVNSFVFYASIAVFTYWHGSKGQLINYLLIWLLYRVYVLRRQIRAVSAMAIAGIIVVVLTTMFALFSNVADLAELANQLSGYADTVRNSMTVIDDPRQDYYYGMLTFENEVYARIPRFLMPNKPKDYGPFRIAKKYDPAAHRSDVGDPNYDIGVTYADFGPFTIALLCIVWALTGWVIVSLAEDQKRTPSIGRFLLLLFFSGVNIIPISGLFLFPETLLLGLLLTAILRPASVTIRPNAIATLKGK
ncbi:hypothetical protein FTW19_10480 [Terriglobus albidus]|uniref:O-antigen polysaccharide polymerase Wzy n=1 Tax=Terriglobus albidus TaxID=1592106 RepID=A0A5B9ECG0_9BACT|nr:hypothetical protein [Terriglobus albidus]QEE28390.1 hypothetical protein FTW19_10480 [Terriglobus albidus]